ncbi:hypothetical protein [Photobacterium damselae]|uniref:hypothetical protein n=1 Tax=Photobacterium damselae TaxID=38293 RepID=UPI001F1939C0|nr:hypothetical protein [Photobacterium damselae]UKA04697.1 hypothetical protein IHC89_24055 [Photobacterium damselae subsp. damselae]
MFWMPFFCWLGFVTYYLYIFNKKDMSKKILILISLAFTGCANTDVPRTSLTFSDTSASQQQIANAWVQLSNSASKAVDATSMLAKVENGFAARKMNRQDYNNYVFQNTYVPVGMEKEVPPLVWDGSFLPVMQMLADMSGYKIVKSAEIPLSVPDVNIDTTKFDKPLNVIDMIRIIESANRDSVKIDVIEPSRIIKISYLR